MEETEASERDEAESGMREAGMPEEYGNVTLSDTSTTSTATRRPPYNLNVIFLLGVVLRTTLY
jgi:hypothetical protein